MKPALLLVDVQNHLLEREGLNPEAARLIPCLESVLRVRFIPRCACPVPSFADANRTGVLHRFPAS